MIPRLAHALLSMFALCSPLLADSPRVLDPRLQLELVAQQPDIVTPVGLAFDRHGDLLVIESHTHHRGGDYQGPPKDRIRRLTDTDGDGKLDTWSTFYEGTEATMSIRPAADGSMLVATRMEVFRLWDEDGDKVADRRDEIAHLETKGRYPHNGLAGLALGPDGRLYFGLGENLGEPYELVGSDGRRLAGGGEGGTIYHCRPDGSDLVRMATGVWNPFGMVFDPVGRLFMVDNDPDSRPPCRLLHIVPGGDYGYQFRYGRTGVHPLQAWNGELPGTLPMAAATGEAPSAVVWYAGQLWGTSWGDHRIERFPIATSGATVQATAQVVVQGDHNFRPVDFAIAPDGSLYFTDWVDRSYPVHGKGRVWRLSWKEAPPASEPVPLSAEEQEAATLRRSPTLAALDSADPFLRQAAVYGFSRAPQTLPKNDWNKLPSAGQRSGILEAMRWADEKGFAARHPELLQAALSDAEDTVRISAVRWIADLQLADFLPHIKTRLEQHTPTVRELPVLLSAIAWLETGSVGGKQDILQQRMLADLVSGEDRPSQLRTVALKLLDPRNERLSIDLLRKLIDSSDPRLARQAVLTLFLRGDEPSRALALDVATDTSRNAEIRALAIVGLSDHADQCVQELAKLADDSHATVRREAARTLRKDPIDNPTPPGQLDAWLEQIRGPADVDAGRRTFFSSKGGYCVRCHRFDGNGADVGPDLTYIGQRMTKRRLLESILQPSLEMSPMYVPKIVLTDDGRVHVGYPITDPHINERRIFVDTAGQRFELDPTSIEEERDSEKSIMPEGFQQVLAPAEMRDLIGFLLQTPADKPAE